MAIPTQGPSGGMPMRAGPGVVPPPGAVNGMPARGVQLGQAPAMGGVAPGGMPAPMGAPAMAGMGPQAMPQGMGPVGGMPPPGMGAVRLPSAPTGPAPLGGAALAQTGMAPGAGGGVPARPAMLAQQLRADANRF